MLLTPRLIVALSLVALCPADPAFTCNADEEAEVLNAVAAWDAKLPEDDAFRDGADALLAGGYDDHCKALLIGLESIPDQIGKKLLMEAKKLDEELGHAMPNGMARSLRDMVTIVETHKSSSVASQDANSSFGRALKNPNITSLSLTIIKQRGATMFRRALQSPAQFDKLCGSKKCKGGARELMHALGVRGYKAKGVPLFVEPAAKGLVAVGKWYRGQLSTGSAETETANSDWASSYSSLFGAQAVDDGKARVRGTQVTAAKKWLHAKFFQGKPKRRLEECYKELILGATAPNNKVNQRYQRIAKEDKTEKKAVATLCLELIRAEREKHVGVDEAYNMDEL